MGGPEFIMSNLRKEIEQTLNRECAEDKSDTPDFILADYLIDCLNAFDKAVNSRRNWYGHNDELPRTATGLVPPSPNE